MALKIIRFAPEGSFMAHERQPVFGAQVADRQDLSVGSEAANTSAFASSAVVRLVAEEDCVIRIGVNAVAASATGDPLPAGEHVRAVRAGERISVIQP